MLWLRWTCVFPNFKQNSLKYYKGYPFENAPWFTLSWKTSIMRITMHCMLDMFAQ